MASSNMWLQEAIQRQFTLGPNAGFSLGSPKVAKNLMDCTTRNTKMGDHIRAIIKSTEIMIAVEE